MDNIEIQNVKKHKHLGLILEKDGRWKDHIEELVTRASRRVDILRGLFRNLERKPLEKLYVTNICPILEYVGII